MFEDKLIDLHTIILSRSPNTFCGCVNYHIDTAIRQPIHKNKKMKWGAKNKITEFISYPGIYEINPRFTQDLHYQDFIVSTPAQEIIIIFIIFLFIFFFFPTPPFSPCEGRQPLMFLLLCSLVVSA